MSRPRLLDLFGCAGIGADGYAAAGFDVVSVDVDGAALRHNPHETVQADALDVLADRSFLAGFDAIHASPPCQEHSVTRNAHKVTHPDLLAPVLDALRAQSLPWIVENVAGAPMPGALVLCGSEFGLRAADPAHPAGVVTLRRHRLFLSSMVLMGAGGGCTPFGYGTCAGDKARGTIAGVYGGGSRSVEHARTVRRGGYTPAPDVAHALIGLERRVPYRFLAQCIPPAYTRFLGGQVLDALRGAA